MRYTLEYLESAESTDLKRLQFTETSDRNAKVRARALEAQQSQDGDWYWLHLSNAKGVTVDVNMVVSTETGQPVNPMARELNSKLATPIPLPEEWRGLDAFRKSLGVGMSTKDEYLTGNDSAWESRN